MPKPLEEVRCDANGLRFRNHCYAWDDIEAVIAFKRDLVTVDCVCLRFALRDGGEFEIDEDARRWESLLAALPVHLPGFPKLGQWWTSVAFPTLAENPTILFERRR